LVGSVSVLDAVDNKYKAVSSHNVIEMFIVIKKTEANQGGAQQFPLPRTQK
jgi:hypothetical protein